MAKTKNQSYQKLTNQLGKQCIKINEPLKNYTYFKIGGPADLFYQANNLEEFKTAVLSAIRFKIPFFILGAGTNILVTDKGFRGLVIRNRASKIALRAMQGSAKQQKLQLKKVTLEVESGVNLNHLVRFSLNEGLKGLEHFLGAPGTLGGAICNNFHYQDQLIGNFIRVVKVITRNAQLKTYSQKQMQFSYDYSILQKTQDIVLSALIELEPADKKEIWQLANQALKKRVDAQPINLPSSGCIFQNISPAQAHRLGTPNFTTSAAYLIDQAGLKGTKIGNAQISSKHANFIVNLGNATSGDVLKLARIVKRKVKTKFGLNLKFEIFIIGER